MFNYLKVVFTIYLKRFLNLFLKKSSDYQKFLILCHPRTGSTLLHTYLNSHAHIYSLGEFIGMDFPDKVKALHLSPVDYLYRKGFRPYGTHIKAVGFKYFYVYNEIPEAKEVLEELQKMDDLKIIHLIRKNTVRTLVSLEIAIKTAGWTKSQEQENVSKTAELDIGD